MDRGLPFPSGYLALKPAARVVALSEGEGVKGTGNGSPGIIVAVCAQRLKAVAFPAEVESVTVAGKTLELSEQVIGECRFAAGRGTAGEEFR